MRPDLTERDRELILDALKRRELLVRLQAERVGDPRQAERYDAWAAELEALRVRLGRPARNMGRP